MSVRAYNEKEGVAGYGGEMAQLDVVCIGLSRAQAREEYRAQDYQVCLLEGNRLPRGEVQAGEEPERAALRVVRESTGLKGCAAISLAADGTLSQSQNVAILYAVPIAHSDIPNSVGQFSSLSSLMTDPSMNKHRKMLSLADQWLRERHALPFLDPSLYFLGGDGEGGGVGGVVRAVIENPVFLCPIPPPEDQLVISLNNPTFSTSTIDLHATQA